MAWPAVVDNMKRYEIIELHVQPEVYVEYVDTPPGIRIIIGVEGSPNNGPHRPAHIPEVLHPTSSPHSHNHASILMLSPFLFAKNVQFVDARHSTFNRFMDDQSNHGDSRQRQPVADPWRPATHAFNKPQVRPHDDSEMLADLGE